MSLADVLDGMDAIFQSVEGVALTLQSEPQSLADTPAIYSLVDRVTRLQDGAMVRVTYRILHRLCLLWQDPEASEAELIGLIDAIPLAVDANPTLSGVLDDDAAFIVSADTGWVKIGAVEYRTVDFVSECMQVVPYGA